jgi:hypothetical protein
MKDENQGSREPLNEFSRESDKKASSFLREFWEFLRENKKWWLTPILLVLSLLGIFIFLGATGAAPFIYSLF